MASYNIQNLSVTAGVAASFSVQQFTISAQVVRVRCEGGAVEFDFTGANAVQWPQVLGTLNAADREELIRMVLTWLLKKKTGIDLG